MFSIIIPYYKKRKYIERCLDSVMAQTIDEFEVILVDDGSKDEIEILVKEKYPKVKLISQENQGVSAARNAGIAVAKNTYISFLDADDAWSPVYLQCVRCVIEIEKEVKIIGTHYTRKYELLERTNENLKFRLLKNYFKKQALRNTLFTSSSTTIHCSFFENNPGFNSNLKRGEDTDVWLRAVASGGKAIFIYNTLSFYSDEDENQATKVKSRISTSIIGLMGNEYLHLNPIPLPEKFMKQYLRKHLFGYIVEEVDNDDASSILKEIAYGNLFSFLLYSLPLEWKKRIAKNPFRRLVNVYKKYLVR